MLPDACLPTLIAASYRTYPWERQSFYNRYLGEPHSEKEGRCPASDCGPSAVVASARSQAAATLRATSKSSSGISACSRQVKATGRSPRWAT